MLHISDPERFQKIASGVQAVLVSVAVVIGGGWTLYTFNSQLQVENAQAQVRKLKREIEAEPKIEISLDLRQVASLARGKYVLSGLVTLKNVGNATTALFLTDDSITIFRVAFNEKGIETWVPVREVPIRVSENATVVALMSHATAANFAPFTVELNEPGIYAVRFFAERRFEEASLALTLGAKPTGEGKDAKISWANHAYVAVK